MPYLLSVIPGLRHLIEKEYRRGIFFLLLASIHLGITLGAIYQQELTWVSPQAGKHLSSSLILYLFLISIWVWSLLDLIKIRKAKLDGSRGELYGTGYWSIVKRRFFRDKKGLTGAIILLIVVYMAMFAPFFSPHHSLKMHLRNTLTPPAGNHPFGTDNFGRDVLTRVIYGSRVALGIGAGAMLINMIWGGFLGLLGGFYKGGPDSVIMRLLEITNCIPYLVWVILVVALFRATGVGPMILILGIFGLYPARIIRSEVLSVREADYIMASRAVGAGDLRVIFRHIMPNSMASLLVTSTMRIGTNIITVAGLSFLGFGITPPTPTWGGALNQAQEFMRTAPWMAVFPGLAIVITVFAFNILGDSLRDVLDPKLR